MNTNQRDQLQALVSLRRRWVWPGYAVALALGVLSSLLQAEPGWMLLFALVLAVAAFHLSISARDYAIRRQVIEAAILWFVVGAVALAAVVSLYGWWRMLIDGG